MFDVKISQTEFQKCTNNTIFPAESFRCRNFPKGFLIFEWPCSKDSACACCEQLITCAFLRPHYDIMVSIGSTLLTLQSPKNSIYAPSGASFPEGASFDVRKVMDLNPISSSKKKTTPNGVVFIFAMGSQIRPRRRQGKGG